MSHIWYPEFGAIFGYVIRAPVRCAVLKCSHPLMKKRPHPNSLVVDPISVSFRCLSSHSPRVNSVCIDCLLQGIGLSLV